MRHIKTYESFGSVNEEFLGIGRLIEKLKGNLRKGADLAKEYMADPAKREQAEETVSKIDSSTLSKLIAKIEAFFLKGGVSPALEHSEEGRSLLDKIGLVLGIAGQALLYLGPIVTAVVGYFEGENLLVLLGAVLFIIIMSAKGAIDDH